MQPARRIGVGDRFADVHGERDDVVFYAGFDFIDAGGIDFRAGTTRGGGVFGHLAGFRERFRGGQLHFQPFGVFAGIAPDAAHFFAGVAWNQGTLPLCMRDKSFVMIRYFGVCGRLAAIQQTATRRWPPQECRDLTAPGQTCLIVRMRESSEMADSFPSYTAGGISDAAAVERTLSGEREAYRVLVERYSAYVYRVAYRMTGNSHDAEEAVQEAFLRSY